ncbi:MAG: ATP-binding protein [Burkholderiaceae bacterium]
MGSGAIVDAIGGRALLLAMAALPTAGLAAAPAAAGAATSPAATGAALGWIFFVVTVAALLFGLRRLRHTAGELVETRQRLQALADVLDVWQWHSDAEHRLIALRPPAGAAASAWSAAELHKPLWDLFRPDDEAAFKAQLDNRSPLDDVPGQHHAAPTEAAVAVRLRGRVRNDAEGNFAGYVGTFRELAAASADPSVNAAPAPSEADHEAFGYTVSHDLRAPIRVVEGFTRILKEDYGRLLDRIGNDHLDRVLGAAARMNAMIDALLALSKLSSQPIARQPVNLTQLAQYVIEDLKRQSPPREVRVHITAGLQALGDPTLLRVVLENLLGNAWKYSAKRADAQIWFERSGHENAMFCVRDNGAGFDMRFADRLFGVFQRLHSANDFQGTGVGLASVRRIIRRHGGEIWAEAEVGRGASFNFSLPLPDRD